jgi:uncharacterized damage-inducible protein DinB
MESFIKLFERDLNKLVDELNNFKSEQGLWTIEGNIKNSAGNLTLHLLGNLNHFIGAVIGESDYIRNRELEFSSRNVPVEQLIQKIIETKSIIKESLQKMDKSKLSEHYPIDVFGEKMTYEYFLIHLVAHLNYHLGQINYLRRLLKV